MLPFPALSHRLKKAEWGKSSSDIYDPKGNAKRGKLILSHFSPTRAQLCIILSCIILFVVLYSLLGRKEVFSDVCLYSNRHNVDTAKLCSFDKDSPDYDCTPVSPHRPTFDFISADSTLSPVVSVVIPFFNDHAFMEDVFESLALQSLKRIEIIVVNDGSTQEATGQMEKLVAAQHDERIRVVSHPKNRGLSAARNTGVSSATAEYIFFIDADDLIEPTTLEKCLWTLISHPHIGFTKGFTVGFGGHTYTWDKGFELAEKFLQENMVTATAMIRKSVFDTVGGYDESVKGGMEDWEFWLKCADNGIWGTTIPEYLDWYRRRPKSSDPKWNNFKEKDRASFLNVLRERYKSIFKLNGFPKLKHVEQINYEVLHKLPFTNPLVKNKPRLLAIVPWFNMGGADRFNLNLIESMVQRGWEVTLVATHTIASSWTSHFMRLTPDVFILSNNLLRYTDYPRFLCYLINSRKIDVVLVTNSEAGYLLLPYIRSLCPGPAIVDYTHMEEMDWKNGGYPRYAVGYSDHLEKHVVASKHLKNWMVNRGVPEQQISVVYIGVDPHKFKSDPASRKEVRQTYNIPTDQITILYAARMIPQKQPMVMVNAFKILAARNIKFTALVAGTGWQRPQIDEFISRHNLGHNVVILGEVPPSQMPNLMSACDIVFLPSEFEGIASIIFEAMALENTIVGADVGGQSELVTSDVGYLQNISGYEGQGEKVVPVLAEMYATELGKLIQNPDLVREKGKKGRERIIQHFALDNMMQQMETEFCEAVKQKGKRVKLPPRTAIETAIQAMQSINGEEYAYTQYAQNEQLKQKMDEMRLLIGQCEGERGEAQSARKNAAKCKVEQESTHDLYMKCERELANVFLELDELRAKEDET